MRQWSTSSCGLRSAGAALAVFALLACSRSEAGATASSATARGAPPSSAGVARLGDATGATTGAPRNALVTARAFVTDSCVRDDQQDVWCWGGGPGAPPLTPTRIKEFHGAAAVVNGVVFSYILKTDGSVWTYGIAQDPGGSAARHDQKIYKDSSVPERFEPLADIIAISAHRSGLALRKDGAIFGWDEDYTKNANDEYDGFKRTKPSLAKSLPKAKALNGSYAIEQGGRLFFIELASNDKTLVPSWIPEVSAATQVVSCEDFMDACALSESGAVACWQRDVATGKVSLVPSVPGLPSATRIACSNNVLYVIDQSGDLYVLDYSELGHRGSVGHAQNIHGVKEIRPNQGTIVAPHCLLGHGGTVGCWAYEQRLGHGVWGTWQSGSEGKPFSAITEPLLKGVSLEQMHPPSAAP